MNVAPGIGGFELIRAFLSRKRDPVGMLADLRDRFGDVARIQVGDTSQFVVSDLVAAKHVLVDNQRNYTKGPGYDRIATILGHGLLTSEGDAWKRHRRMVQPSLQQDRMRGFIEVMQREAQVAARKFEGDADDGIVVDALDDMLDLALRVISNTMLGAGVEGREADIHEALTEVLHHIERLSVSKLRVLELLPGGSRLRPLVLRLAMRPSADQRRFQKAVTTLDGIIGAVITKRRGEAAAGGTGSDLVSLLVAARDDQGVALTDTEIRDEVMTMYLAGHETTATALAWTLHLLSMHPEYQDRIVGEAAGSPLGDAPSMADIARLEITGRVLDESMRLYPPVWRISRAATAADIVGGYDVPAGSIVIVSPYLVHHDPRHWTEPERFDPDRFLKSQSEGRSRMAFIPFGAGPRMCLGEAFARAEAQIVLSAICTAVRFEPIPGWMPAFEASVTLRPAGGVPLRVRRRDPRRPGTPA